MVFCALTRSWRSSSVEGGTAAAAAVGGGAGEGEAMDCGGGAVVKVSEETPRRLRCDATSARAICWGAEDSEEGGGREEGASEKRRSVRRHFEVFGGGPTSS